MPTFLETRYGWHHVQSDLQPTKEDDSNTPLRIDPKSVNELATTLLVDVQENNIEDLSDALPDEIKKSQPLTEKLNQLTKTENVDPRQAAKVKASYSESLETLKVNVKSEIENNLPPEVQNSLIVKFTEATERAKENFSTVLDRTTVLKNNSIGLIVETDPTIVQNQLQAGVKPNLPDLIVQTQNQENKQGNKTAKPGPQRKQDEKFHFVQSIKQAFNNIEFVFGRTVDELNEREDINKIPTIGIKIESPDIGKTTDEQVHAAIGGAKAHAASGALLCLIGMAMCIYMAVNPSPEKQLERAVIFSAQQAIKRGVDPDLVVAAVEKMTVTIHHGKNALFIEQSVVDVINKERLYEKLSQLAGQKIEKPASDEPAPVGLGKG